jgi:hypothetical protein
MGTVTLVHVINRNTKRPRGSRTSSLDSLPLRGRVLRVQWRPITAEIRLKDFSASFIDSIAERLFVRPDLAG